MTSVRIENVPAFIEAVKSGQGSRLMGFGHRVYKNMDPRAAIMKQTCDEVLKELEKQVLTEIRGWEWRSGR